MNCPECQQPMTKKSRGDVTLDACPQCRGLWFDSGEIDDLKDQLVPPELRWTDFDLWRHQAGFEVSFDPLHCPRCQGSWMTAGDFAGIVSALTTELDNRTTADYVRESLKQAADLVKNKEDPISDWKDLKAVLRLLKFRFFVENPKLDAVMKGFQKSMPL